jgi:hypothetical protein
MSVASLVAAFAANPRRGVFTHFSHTEVLQGIRNRLANPDMISQGDASLCGPASFLHCIIKDYPETWVNYVTQLYMTGSGRIHGLEVKPSRDCLNANPSGLKAVDWIALASLRDSENTFFDYQSSSNELGGITMPATMASWFEKAGYKQVTNNTNLFFTKDADTLKTAVGLAGQKRRVCMFINARMIANDGGASGVFSTANHWVVLQGGAGINGTQATLKIWTWGESNTHGFNKVERVLTNNYGYVSAMCARAA